MVSLALQRGVADMQIGWRVAKQLVVLGGIMVVTAAPSRAVDVTLDIFQNGQSAGSLNASQLGCSDTGATSAHCSAQNLAVGDVLIQNLNFNLNTDPVVNAVIAVQNMAALTQQITLTITLPTGPVGNPTTRTG